MGKMSFSPNTTTSLGKHVRDDPDIPLSKLIQHAQWDAVLLRLAVNPLQAELELEVTTRGGFMASAGFTPLHYACERQPPIQVIESLIGAHPVGVLTRTMPGGALPLHIACTWYASTQVVQALLTADQGACKVTDELGNVALHSACFSGADLDIVEVLTTADPQTVLCRNHQGSRPADVSKRLRHSNRKAVLALLTLKKEEVLAKLRRRVPGVSAALAAEAADFNANFGSMSSRHHEKDSPVDDLQDSAAIEVSLAGDGKDELLWI